MENLPSFYFLSQNINERIKRAILKAGLKGIFNRKILKEELEKEGIDENTLRNFLLLQESLFKEKTEEYRKSIDVIKSVIKDVIENLNFEEKKKKLFGIIPRRVRELEPKSKIEKLFEVLEEYYPSSYVYSALRELEDEDSNNREKISYLIEKYRNRNKYKEIAISLLILSLIAGAVASYYLSKTKTYDSPILTTTPSSTTLVPENKIPEIESLEYKEKVKKGELQEIKLVVNDENPYKVVLKLNNTVIDVPFHKKIDNNRTVFSVSFDPKKYFEKEGKVYGNVTVYDEGGKSSSKDLSFFVNLEEPKIDVNIRKVGFGKYELHAKIFDENLEEVKLFLNGKELNLLKENGLYKAFIEVYEDSNFTLIAKDRFGLESKFSGSIFVSKDSPNAYYALKRGLNPNYINLILSLDNDSVQDSNEKDFIDYLINIQKYLEDERLKNEILKFTSDGKITSDEINFLRIISKNSDENVKSILNIYFNSPKTFKEILRNAYNDANVKIDRDVFVGEVCNIAEKLGIGDNVKVLNVKNNSFEIKEINLPTIQAIGNYTLAIKQLNLPIHEKENIWLLTNATMINTDIFDFNPVIVKDMYGNSYVILSKNIARDVWALVEHLKYDPEIIKYPEIYLALSIKVQQNMYDLVDNPVLHEREEYYNPDNRTIWEKVIIPQWKYYRDSFPQFGNVSKRIIVFPIYDSSLLRKWIPNEDDLKIALMFFWNVYIDRRGIADIDEWRNKKRVWHQGLDGIIYTIEQMPRVYNDVINAYNRTNL